MKKEARTYNGVNTVYSINGLRNIGQIHAKNETRPPSYTTSKNQLRMEFHVLLNKYTESSAKIFEVFWVF